MHYSPLTQDDILGGKEICFISRQETNHTQLMRLAMDFEMCILQVQRRSFSHISKRFLPVSPVFVLVGRDYLLDHTTYSPFFDSLEELDMFVRDQHVDILHSYLFGSSTAETA